MGQPGFFDLENRYAGLDTHGDPLVAINAAVPSVLRQRRTLASHTGKSGKRGTYCAFFISRTLLPNMRSQKIAVIA